MTNFVSESKYEIKGRGTVFVVDLQANNVSPYRKEWKNILGSDVAIDGEVYKVKGIEAFATAMDVPHSKVGLLVG